MLVSTFVKSYAYGDCHEYLAEAQQFLAQKDAYRQKYLAAIFTHYWRNLAYRHTYLAKPYFVL
jgi:hypothetical protein